MRDFRRYPGAVFGHTLLNIMKIRTKAARGLAMGTASHALGTARCAELDYQEGAFSSLALVICGIITSRSRRLSSRLFWQQWAKICDASRKFHFHFISCTHNEIWITYKGRTAPYTTDPLTLMRQRHASTFSSCFLSACREFAISPAPVLADAHFPALLTADQVTTLKQATGLDEDTLAFALLPRRLPAPALTFPILT